MRRKKIKILYKDKDILVCEKPSGMPVSSDKTGDMDLMHQLKNQIYFEEGLNEEPEFYLVHGWIVRSAESWYLQETRMQQQI